MNPQLKAKIMESLSAVLPITGIVLALSILLVPLCIGACATLGGNIMTDAFGAVALVALTPLISVQIMGIAYRIKLHAMEKRKSLTKQPCGTHMAVFVCM